MSQQNFGDESNYKHEPHADHYVKDKFCKGTNTRNWKRNLDESLEDTEDLEASDTNDEEGRGEEEDRVPPGSPDTSPMGDPDQYKAPKGDPIAPERKKPRL